jgi:hypothetical protein
MDRSSKLIESAKMDSGDVVWAKGSPSYPFWPSVIYDPAQLPAHVKKMLGDTHAGSQKRAVMVR